MSRGPERKRKQPTYSEFDKIRTGDVKMARRFIEKYGAKACDPKEGRSALSYAAANEKLEVVNEFLSAGASLWNGLHVDYDPVYQIASNPNERVALSLMSSLEREAAPRVVKDCYIAGSATKVGEVSESASMLELYACMGASEELARGAVGESKIKTLEYLLENGHLCQETMREVLRKTWRSENGRAGFNWLLSKCDELSEDDISHLLARQLSPYFPNHDAVVSLIEASANTKNHEENLHKAMADLRYEPDSECLFMLGLAGVDLKPVIDIFNSEKFSTVRAVATGFTPLALTDPFVASFWAEYSTTALFLIRDRVTEVCIALQSLDLPVLLLCETMQQHYHMWPGVPFHHYWNICKAVQDQYRHSRAQKGPRTIVVKKSVVAL